MTTTAAETRAALGAIAAVWRPERLDAGAREIDFAPVAAFRTAIFERLAGAPLRGDWDEPLAAIALFAQFDPSNPAAWPTDRHPPAIPPAIAPYVQAILNAGDAEGLACLILGARRAARAAYWDSGLYEPLAPGATMLTMTGAAKDGRAVALAFRMAAVAAAVAGADEEQGARSIALLKAHPALRDAVVEALGGQRYMAGGFEVAMWADSISGYFADAGHALHEDLGEVIARLTAA